VGWRKPEDVKVHLPPVFAKLGIGFHACGARQLRPDRNEVLLNTGGRLLTTISSSRRGRSLPSTRSKALGPKPTRVRSATPTMRRRPRSDGKNSAKILGRWWSEPFRARPASGRPMNTR
jgi:hypothetical protein